MLAVLQPCSASPSGRVPNHLQLGLSAAVYTVPGPHSTGGRLCLLLAAASASQPARMQASSSDHHSNIARVQPAAAGSSPAMVARDPLCRHVLVPGSRAPAHRCMGLQTAQAQPTSGLTAAQPRALITPRPCPLASAGPFAPAVQGFRAAQRLQRHVRAWTAILHAHCSRAQLPPPTPASAPCCRPCCPLVQQQPAPLPPRPQARAVDLARGGASLTMRAFASMHTFLCTHAPTTVLA